MNIFRIKFIREFKKNIEQHPRFIKVYFYKYINKKQEFVLENAYFLKHPLGWRNKLLTELCK